MAAWICLFTKRESKPLSCTASRGEYFREKRDQEKTVSFHHPNGECSICFADIGLQMECGHYICSDCLLTCAWEQLSNMKHEIVCIGCDEPIKLDDLIKFGVPTLEEEQSIVTAITANFYKSQDIQECPKCGTLCQKTEADNPRIQCGVCPKKRGEFFMFCWSCKRKWKNASDDQVCGNKDCKEKGLIEKLINSPKKLFEDYNGKKVYIPTIRACPRCHTMLEHSDGCNTFTCSTSTCKHIFCFICLSDKTDDKSCESISWDDTGIRCSPAPIQTKLK